MSVFRGAHKLSTLYTQELCFGKYIASSQICYFKSAMKPQICSLSSRNYDIEKNKHSTTFNNKSHYAHKKPIYYWYIARPFIAMGIASLGCFGLYYITKEARAKEIEDDEPRFVLYQYSNCPFCSKVRTYLQSSGKSFRIVEVNPVTKVETKNISDGYKKVPILIADGHLLKDSSLITSMLETHFTTGKPLSEIIELYPAVTMGIEDTNNVYVIDKTDRDGNKNYIIAAYAWLYAAYKSYKMGKDKLEHPNKYRIMGYDPDHNGEMIRIVKFRKWIDENFVHLISPNVYRTWAEALEAFDFFTANGNFTEFQRVYIRYIGAAAMYFIGGRLQRRHNLSNDVRDDLYSGLNYWLRSLKGRSFHGGEEPNLADIEMFGMCSSFYGMPCWDDACQNTKILPWYNRMEKYLEARSAVEIPQVVPNL